MQERFFSRVGRWPQCGHVAASFAAVLPLHRCLAGRDLCPLPASTPSASLHMPDLRLERLRPRPRPLTPWELQALLIPMHAYRRTKKKWGSERKHFPAILSFVYRNRFAVANQIQRRFADVLKSDRTARRHLEEMEALGYLGVAPTRSTSPLWPKVYHLTKRGARRLREVLDRKGKPGNVIRVERARPEGYSADHVLHEIFITEFLLAVWQTTRSKDDLDLLATERRSLSKHPAFRLVTGGRASQLEPDAMFLFRQEGRGMMCCFLEMDMGSMSQEQLRRKFERYERWTESDAGKCFLHGLYDDHGAINPRPVFRLLVVASDRLDDDRRLLELVDAAKAFPLVRGRCRFTTVAELRKSQSLPSPLEGPLWRRPWENSGLILHTLW